jgi:hypothetical protein
MKQISKLQLLAILATIGCFNNGYTDFNNNIINNKQTTAVKNIQTTDKVIKNNTLVNSNKLQPNENKTTTQLSINEQLDNRINDLNELITLTSKDMMKPDCSCKESMANLIKELQKLICNLKAAKELNLFPKLVDFVRKNSKELLEGKEINFSSVFKPFEEKMNDALREVYCPDYVIEIKVLELLKPLYSTEQYNMYVKEKKELNNAMEFLEVPASLIFEALSMCPELKIKRILKPNKNDFESQGDLINAIQTKDGRVYTHSGNKGYIYGLIKLI